MLFFKDYITLFLFLYVKDDFEHMVDLFIVLTASCICPLQANSFLLHHCSGTRNCHFNHMCPLINMSD